MGELLVEEFDIFPSLLSYSAYGRQCSGYFEYQITGIRETSFLLSHVMYRMGILAVLRSKATKAAVGLMITGCHCTEIKNGIRIIDSYGEILEIEWMKIATRLVNVPDNEVKSTLLDICIEQNIDLNIKATVVVGNDSRFSTEDMVYLVAAGISALEGTIIKAEAITTPQLYYIVAKINGSKSDVDIAQLLEKYYLKLGKWFRSIMEEIHREEIKHHDDSLKNEIQKYTYTLYLDCANGVGGNAAIKLKKELEKFNYKNIAGELVPMVIRVFNELTEREMKIKKNSEKNEEESTKDENKETNKFYENTPESRDKLNKYCGSYFVKNAKKVPNNNIFEKNVKCASIDGDADEIVYYYVDETDKFHLFDGDRIAALLALYIKELLVESGLNLKLGVIQTLYSNGGATKYLRNDLGIDVVCVSKTKYLHNKAKKFDIGIYFKKSGYGTICFNKHSKDKFNELINVKKRKSDVSDQSKFPKQIKSGSDKRRNAAIQLKNIYLLTAKKVGDALCNMLLIESILCLKNWSLSDWEDIYKELYSTQRNVYVDNNTSIGIETGYDTFEIYYDLQAKVDTAVSQYKNADEDGDKDIRCFIRPSETGKMARIYAEGKKESDVQELVNTVLGFTKSYVCYEDRSELFA